MKPVLIALCAALPIAAGGCATTGYGGYGGGPYAYDGYYDDYYGPIHDGYWGTDGFFYYRGHAEDRRFVRGDPAHFNRGGPPPGAGAFHPFNGQFTRARGMSTPHFGGGRGGGAHAGGGHAGGGHR